MAVKRFERLIANESEGAQMHLIYCFQKWQQSIGVAAAERQTALVRFKTGPNDEGSSTTAEWSLDVILKSSKLESAMVQYYDKCGELGKTNTKILRDSICEYAHEKYQKLSRSMCGEIIAEIMQRFPKADVLEFETDAVKHHGPLYTRYQSMFNKPERAIKREAGDADQADGPEQKKSVTDSNKAVKAARRCAEIDSRKGHEYYVGVWRKSTSARLEDRDKLTTEEFLKEWPLYTQEIGIDFMRIDFETWLGAPALSIDDEFEECFANKYLSAIRSYRVRYQGTANVEDDCKDGTTNAIIEIILRCLSQIFKPTAKAPEGLRMYTPEESFDSIIYKSVRVAPPRHHPIIVPPQVGGSPYILAFYDFKWKFKSLLQTVICAVELFATLNLKAPKVRRNNAFYMQFISFVSFHFVSLGIRKCVGFFERAAAPTPIADWTNVDGVGAIPPMFGRPGEQGS